MQALEIIKVITGIGENLNGKFLVYDALSTSWRSFAIKRDPANPLNGETPTITSLIDYDAFCHVKKEEGINEIGPEELYRLLLDKEDIQLVDVREPEEYTISNIGGELIPLKQILENVEKIQRQKKVVFHCQTGNRSKQAINLLKVKFGFDNLYNLTGGLSAYTAMLQLRKP
jgi:sulfur-carrier protein adenylyltransferase/sulfurtransferase